MILEKVLIPPKYLPCNAIQKTQVMSLNRWCSKNGHVNFFVPISAARALRRITLKEGQEE